MLFDKPKKYPSPVYYKKIKPNAKLLLYDDVTHDISTVRYSQFCDKKLTQGATIMHKLLTNQLDRKNIYVYAYEYVGEVGPCAFICCKAYETDKDYLQFEKMLKQKYKRVKIFRIKGDML